jgi:hypothetical protein
LTRPQAHAYAEIGAKQTVLLFGPDEIRKRFTAAR